MLLNALVFFDTLVPCVGSGMTKKKATCNFAYIGENIQLSDMDLCRNKMDKEAEEKLYLDDGEMLDIKKEGILVSSILQPREILHRSVVSSGPAQPLQARGE
ncbi:hypothetical protein KI387_026685, partial [Taxus chinensis]